MFNFFKKGETPESVYGAELRRVYSDPYPIKKVEREAKRANRERYEKDHPREYKIPYPVIPKKK